MSTTTTNTDQITDKGLTETIGALTGVAGSLLLALNNEYSAYAWPIWLISNLSLIKFMHTNTHLPTMLMHCCYLLSTLVGIYKWWLVPLF